MQQEEENQIEKEEENQEEETSKVSQEPQQQQSHAPEFDEWVTEKPRVDYIRISAGETKIMRFKSDKPDIMLMSNFGGKSRDGRLVPVARYMVRTPEDPNKEVAFDVTAKSLARDIQVYYNKGFTELEITKLNTTPISYRVVPVVARERQRQMATTNTA